MELATLAIYGLGMAIGLVGVVLPLVPGLLLIALVGGVWAYDTGGVAWLVFAGMLVVLALGSVAKYVLPSRSLKAAGAPVLTQLVGALGALVGFFAIPVVGFLVGGVLAVFVAEWVRLGSASAAGRSTLATAKSIGVGVAIELGAGIVAVGGWLIAALTLR